jgi:hypothetical protein
MKDYGHTYNIYLNHYNLNNWFNQITPKGHSRFPQYMLSYKPTGKAAQEKDE